MVQHMVLTANLVGLLEQDKAAGFKRENTPLKWRVAMADIYSQSARKRILRFQYPLRIVFETLLRSCTIFSHSNYK